MISFNKIIHFLTNWFNQLILTVLKKTPVIREWLLIMIIWYPHTHKYVLAKK